MSINPFTSSNISSQHNTDMILTMRAQLDDLQRQLSTGLKATTYGGLGADRRVSLNAHGKLATIASWDDGITQASFRLKMMNQSVDNFATMVSSTKSALSAASYSRGATGQTPGQLQATSQMQQAIDGLNIDINGHYLFSGRAADVRPVQSFDLIMNGDGAGRAGVKQLISERKQADAGAGQGRLTAASAGTTATLDEEATNPPYGFKIAGATFSGTGVTPALTAGPPAHLDVNVTGTPNVGDTLQVTLRLPDGTQETLTLTARAAGATGAAEDSFAIGATPAATAANISASLTASLTRETQTSLAAASSIVAANSFFNGSASNPPLRVPGPGFATATAAPAAGTAANTVIWYQGDDSSAVSARNTGSVQVDSAQTVGIGARANEQAFRNGLAQFAALSAEVFSASDPNAQRHYAALATRAGTNLGYPPGTQKPQDISVELASAQSTLGAAKDRHATTKGFLTDALAQVENASPEEVSASILALQTRLQASYQTTALLSKLSLTNYIQG